ncbi:MAG: type II secretion system secretin GspD [Deltaproteobacteria bacterium]|nr:type II secretion system secretin GspD [Deltaproteobacteria bacterium]
MKIKKIMVWLFLLLAIIPCLGGPAWAQKNSPLVQQLKDPILTQKSSNEKVTMDFDNVDIRLVIKFMSELTGKNFILDDRVKGKVTVISPMEIKVKDAYAIFESILEVNGYTAVTSGNITKIIPESHAASKNLETISGDSSGLEENYDDSMVTQIIALEYAEADKVKAILHPLISRESKILSYLPTNMLILTERVSNINRLMKIIKQIDVENGEAEISIIHIQYARVDVLAKQLQTIFGEKTISHSKGKKSKPERGIKFKIIPDERTDSIILMAGPELLKEVRELIQELDIPTPQDKDDIHVYFLKNSKAEDMAKVLAQIMTKTLAKKGKEGKPETPPTVVADKATNSLIITASPEDYKVLERVIQKLDIMRPQVLVEALIAEVSYNKSRDLGVEWRAMREISESGSIVPFGGTNFGEINAITGNIMSNPLAPQVSGMFIGLTKGFIEMGGISFPNLAALIAAYQQDGDVNILSTPHLLTTDNEEAEIIVGEEVPISARDVINDNISYSTNYKNVGLTLRLTPHINHDGYIKLEVYQEIKKVMSFMETPAGPTPRTTTRQARTTVMLKDSQTAVLGGMIQDDSIETSQRVPCLGSIPLLGWAFRSTHKDGEKKNLQIFITPHIIKNPEDINVFTTEKKDKLKDQEKKYQIEGTESK